MPQAAANGLSLEYESRGDPADPAIVMVMGLGLQMIMWPDALCDAVVARGFRVVRFDSASMASIMSTTGSRRLPSPAIAATGDRTAVVKRIQAPTLVIHGDEDPLLRPACGEATARAINEGGGRARLEMVKGMGHDLPVPLLPPLAEAIAAHCKAA